MNKQIMKNEFFASDLKCYIIIKSFGWTIYLADICIRMNWATVYRFLRSDKEKASKEYTVTRNSFRYTWVRKHI